MISYATFNGEWWTFVWRVIVKSNEQSCGRISEKFAKNGGAKKCASVRPTRHCNGAEEMMICGIFDGQKKRVKVPAERGSVPEKESVVVTARRKCSPHSTRPQRPCSVARPSKFPAHGNIASRLLVSCAYSGPAPPPELIRNHRSEILKINIG